MNLNIISTIASDIIINESVEDNFYEYVKNIVERYDTVPLKVVLKVWTADWFVEVELYNNARSI